MGFIIVQGKFSRINFEVKGQITVEEYRSNVMNMIEIKCLSVYWSNLAQLMAFP